MGKPKYLSFDIPITEERIANIRDKLREMMAIWPESKAQAKAQRKAALGLLEELVSEIAAIDRAGFDNLMAPSIRREFIRKVETRLKLE